MAKKMVENTKKSIFHPNNLSFLAREGEEVFVQSCAETCLLIFEIVTNSQNQIKSESFYYVNYEWSIIMSKVCQIFSEMKT